MDLESKSEYIVEKNIYHLVIFQKCFCLWWYYLQTKIYVKVRHRPALETRVKVQSLFQSQKFDSLQSLIYSVFGSQFEMFIEKKFFKPFVDDYLLTSKPSLILCYY